ncbi:MAG: WD40 repeat domain-containing protein [Candidatus Poribacteria bacterium]|nr:WD40 repeat domain-containing protein [Candidatus Poribacteria bacterium]
MDNRRAQSTAQSPQTNSDVTTWELPAGAIARLGRGQIGRMAFSPDGTHLAVPTRIGCWLYNLDTMTNQALWATERGMVATIAFSDNAKWVATSDWDGVVKIWDTQNLQCVAEIDASEDSGALRVAATNLTFLPDGQHLAMYYFDTYPDQTPRFYDRQCAVYDWRTDTDTPIKSYTIKSGRERDHVTPIAISSDGSLFAYTSDANMTSVICMETGEQIAELHDDYTEQSIGGCHRLVFSPCGQYLAACNIGNKVHVWNIHNGALEIAPTPYGGNSYIKFGLPFYTMDGNLRVAGIGGIEIVLWDAAQQETIDTFKTWNPFQRSACFSADSTRFAVANGRGELHVWTEGTPSTLVSLPVHHQNVSPVSFSNDSRTLVSTHKTRSAVCVWNVTNRQVKRTFHFENSNPNISGAIVTSPGGELLATNEEKEDTISVWHLPSDTQVAEFTGKKLRVRKMVFSPTGEYLVSANNLTPIKVWDVASGTQVTELPRRPSSHVSKIGFPPTGTYFVIIYGDSIAVWDVQQWEKLYHAPLTPQTYPGWKLHFDLNGKQFFTRPPRGAAIVWNFKSNEQIGLLDIEPCIDTSIYKGMLQDLQRAQERQREGPRRIRALQTSTCHDIIAGGMWGEIRLWDATTFKVRMALIQPTGCQSPYALAFSPCGNYLASGSRWDPQWEKNREKTSIRLWDITTGENIHTFWAHPTDILSINFSPDGELLASSSYDGTILLWDMKPFINT